MKSLGPKSLGAAGTSQDHRLTTSVLETTQVGFLTLRDSTAWWMDDQLLVDGPGSKSSTHLLCGLIHVILPPLKMVPHLYYGIKYNSFAIAPLR